MNGFQTIRHPAAIPRLLAGLLLATSLFSATLAHAGGLHGYVFALDKKGEVIGYDVGPTGKVTVSGAKIEFTDQGGRVAATVTSDDDGYYSAELSPGVYYYKVTAPGFRDEDVRRGVRVQLTTGLAPFDFSLTPGKTDPDRPEAKVESLKIGTLMGRVWQRTAQADQLPIPGVRIVLHNPSASTPIAHVVAAGSEGGEHFGPGEYGIVLEAGSWQAAVSAPGFVRLVDPNPIAIRDGQETTRDFILERPSPQPAPVGQGIRGTVVLSRPDTGGGEPPAISVSILPLRTREDLRQDATALRALSPATDAGGNYVQDLAAGRYQVVARARGYQTARSGPRAVYPQRYTHVDLALLPLREEDLLPGPLVLTIAVVSEDVLLGKQPLPGAELEVYDPQGRPLLAPGTTTNQRGVKRVTVGTAGHYRVFAHKTDKGYVGRDATVEVAERGENRGKIVLAKSALPEIPQLTEANLALQVLSLDPEGVTRVVPEAKIVITGTGPPVTATADAEGRREIKLRPGSQHLEVNAEGCDPARLRVFLDAQRRLLQIERHDARGQQSLITRPDVAENVLLAKSALPEIPQGKVATLLVQVLKPRPGAQLEKVSRAKVQLYVAGQPRPPKYTEGEGMVTFSRLPKGEYEVRVDAVGFPQKVHDVDLSRGDVSMQVLLGGPAKPGGARPKPDNPLR